MGRASLIYIKALSAPWGYQDPNGWLPRPEMAIELGNKSALKELIAGSRCVAHSA